MKFKVGEKVKFLNESGGGRVVALIDNRMVKIETDDGFEMPVLTSELIKDFRAEQTDEQAVVFNKPTPITSITENTEDEPETITQINLWGNAKEENGVYLAYVPHEQQWVLTGDLDIYILNHTKHDILYNLYFEQDNRLTGIDYGSVPPDSKCLVETIVRDDIENWCKGFIQLMFHHDNPSTLFLPTHNQIALKPGRFFNEGSYKPNTLLQDKALIVIINTENTLEKVKGSEQEQKTSENYQAGKPTPTRDKPFIDQYKSGLFEAVVDLHIGELLDNIAGLSSHDMFSTQMEYFTKALDSALDNDYRKITFIHGVGNGVLKNAIVKAVEEYDNPENKTASITKFGVGALDVMIKTKE